MSAETLFPLGAIHASEHATTAIEDAGLTLSVGHTAQLINEIKALVN